MGVVTRIWLVGLLCLGVSSSSSAQVFQLSTDPDTLKDPTGASVTVRPSVPETRYVFVRNPVGNQASYTVEMRDASNGALLATGSLKNMKANDTLRVKLEKAPPPAPKTAAPAAPAPTPAPERPQGLELKGKDGNFKFVLRLLDDKGDLVMVDRKPAESPILVIYRNPRDYFGIPTIRISKKDGAARVDVEITSKADFRGPPATVELVIPPQASVRFDALRGGTSRRTVADKNQSVRLLSDQLPLIDGQERSVRFDINIDGYARVFKYEANFSILNGTTEMLQFDRMPSVTVLPVGADRAVRRISAKAADKTPVRIQVDNAPINSRLALRFDRDQNRQFSGGDELIVIGNPREEHVFVEPSGENDAILFTYRVTDHTYFLDTRSMRGPFELQGVLLDQKDDAKIIRSQEGNGQDVVFSVDLILDDTAPEGLQFAKLPAKHVKGTPLQVQAFADEPETSVIQAIFFVGKPVDGKLPDTKVEGELIDRKKNQFVGRVPIPDKQGVIEVGVQFTNEVGLSSIVTRKIAFVGRDPGPNTDPGIHIIELIDPPPPGGRIAGIIERGGAGIEIWLRDGDGNENGPRQTGEQGTFQFDDLPPGIYRLYTRKPGAAAKSDATFQVQSNKETKITINLPPKK
jgi:Carboxypeptidase regulatory-like domain